MIYSLRVILTKIHIPSLIGYLYFFLSTVRAFCTVLEHKTNIALNEMIPSDAHWTLRYPPYVWDYCKLWSFGIRCNPNIVHFFLLTDVLETRRSPSLKRFWWKRWEVNWDLMIFDTGTVTLSPLAGRTVIAEAIFPRHIGMHKELELYCWLVKFAVLEVDDLHHSGRLQTAIKFHRSLTRNDTRLPNSLVPIPLPEESWSPDWTMDSRNQDEDLKSSKHLHKDTTTCFYSRFPSTPLAGLPLFPENSKAVRNFKFPQQFQNLKKELFATISSHFLQHCPEKIC